VQLLLVLASAVILRFEFRGTYDHILLSQIRDSLSMEGQVPVFISPRNRVAQLYSEALGSLFVTSYDSLGYGGGIRSRLHTGQLTAIHVKVEVKVTTDGQSAILSWFQAPISGPGPDLTSFCRLGMGGT
jgi:hypothetical protein